MAVKIVGKNPEDIKRYREQMKAQGLNTKRSSHPVYKNKPEDFRTINGSIKLLSIKESEGEGDTNPEDEDDTGKGEQGTVDETAYDPDRKLIIKGMANANIVDRMDERVDPRGGDFKNFLLNPIMLADHMYWTSSIVGTVLELTPEEAGTGFTAEIGDPTKGPLTQEQLNVRTLIAQGYIKTVSIGFIPTKIQAPTFDDQGRMVDPAVILTWELLEISLVAVPANPEATFEMKQMAENALALNATGKGVVNGLTTQGANEKNNSSTKTNQAGISGETKKGLDLMEPEEIKELLEGISGLGTGLSALAEAQKSSNEMQTEMLGILKGKGSDEDEDKEEEDEDEDKEKRLKAMEDQIKELNDNAVKAAEIIGKLINVTGITLD